MTRKTVELALLVTGLCGLAAGCSTRTDVSVTGNTRSSYSHVWITAQEVWFNASASAGPGDGGWVKFPLSTPATVDLVAESGGNLGNLVTGLRLAPGSYSQVRLIPLDPSASLASSASTAGAIYNAEADYVDSAGTTHQLPLELLDPGQGIGIQGQGSLDVPIGNLGASLGGVSSSTTPGTTGGATTSTSTGSSTTTATFALAIDGVRGLTPFTYAGASSPNAILLSSHASAYDLSKVGGISGQLTLTNLTGINGSTGVPAIQVNAEVLSAADCPGVAACRHVVVSSTPVHADGSFLLYPLSTSSSSTPAQYDVVIHGPGIATIIIKAVQVSAPSSTSSSANSSTSSTTGTGTSSNTTATNTVSVGTLIPRAATSYTVNLATTGGAAQPAGAQVAFLQTLTAQGEVPYVIEASPIDPFNQVLAYDEALSTGTIDSGTWNSAAATVNLVSAAPAENAGGLTGAYRVAASAPDYNDGPLTTIVSAPSSGTTATPVTLSALALAPGAAGGTISATITQATAGRYDHGELLLAHDGTLVATTPLDTALAQGAGATVTLGGVPSGTPDALYYATVRVWNSSNPAPYQSGGTLRSQSYTAAIDLRGSASGALQLTID